MRASSAQTTRNEKSRGKSNSIRWNRGRTMKKYLLATVSILALSTAVRAADLPAKSRPYAPDPVPIWTGGYIGIQGGVTRHDASFNDLGCSFSCATHEGNKTGGTIGGLLGYNWQRGSFVYGLEGDWNWVGAKAASEIISSLTFAAKSSFDVDWVATVRGRAGLAVDATLIYLTGGIAFGRVNNSFTSFNLNSGDIFIDFTHKQTKVGWTAGAGVEHMFDPHWTVRAEFRYVDLGATNVACTPPSLAALCTDLGYRGEFSNTLLQGLVGLTYKF